MTNAALPVPALVRRNWRDDRSARVKSIFPNSSVAEIVFPASYANSREIFAAFAGHSVIS